MLLKATLIAMAAALALSPSGGQAQSNWPERPIHWIIPFPAGGQAEISSRIIAEKISPSLGQPIVIEARPGAGGNIGTEEVSRAAPDGYTWLGTGVPFTTSVVVNPSTTNFDPVNDFEHVGRFGSTTFVLTVPADLPVNTLDEFLDYARENDLSYAASSIGSLVHLSTEMFKLATGIDMAAIPYTGQPPAIADLIAGRVQFMALGLAFAQPLMEAGDIKALAVLDGDRHPNVPDVPSIAELGYPDLMMGGWGGLHVPAGTAPEIVERINAEVMAAIQSPDTIEQLANAGWRVVEPNTPEEFKDFVESEIERWSQVVNAADIEVN